MFTIRFVGSPPLLLILSGHAKYFFIPFKGTSKPQKRKEEKRKEKKKKNVLNKKRRKKKENDHV